jgi:hypothetical protein
VNKQVQLVIAIVVILTMFITFVDKGLDEVAVPAAGQAEETFGLNSTFLAEVEKNETAVPSLADLMQKQQRLRVVQTGEAYVAKAPMVISGDNAYVVWNTNETGNLEVMFRASNDGGETFDDKMNLSNSTKNNSRNAEIVAAGDKVMLSWQESGIDNNLTNYVLRMSDDAGQTFGPLLQLSANGSIGDREANFLTYENSDFGVQIEYPNDWTIEDVAEEEARDGVGNLAGFFSPFENRLDNYKERLWMSVDTLKGNMTIEEYSAQVVHHNNDTLRNFSLIGLDTDSVFLGGYPAYEMVSTQVLEDGRPVRQMEVGTIVNDVVYYVTYYSEETKYRDFLPLIQDIINSLRIEG